MVAPKNQPSAKMRAMVAQAESGKMQAADDTGKQADAFEEEIAELKVAHDKYFLGLERFEPIKEREDLKARLVKFKSGFIRNTGVRFRVQAQYQKFLSLERMWLRIAKEIEEGTYSRDLFKAKMRGEKRKKKDDPKKKKGEAFDLSAEENEQAEAAPKSAEPKTDPHLVIPAELRARGTPVTADDPPLVMPAPMAVRPPPPPAPSPSPTARTDALPALVPPASGGPPRAKPPPPPPMTSPGMAAAAPPRNPSSPPVPVFSPSPASRVSGTQPAVVPASSKTSGPIAAIKPTGSPSASQGLPKVSPPTSSSTSSPGMRALPPPPPGSTAARPPPPPPSAGGARPPPPPGAPRPSAGAPALGEDKMKAIYSAYLSAKRQCKESTDGITYESVSRTINTQVPELMKEHNAKAVDFKVVIKNGKATLKAVPKV